MKSRTTFLVVVIGVIIAAALWHWRMSYPFDDAYITFRYAENLARGYGIVWNVGGLHTEGYTNFLLVLILSPFAFFNTDLMAVSQLIGITTTILTALVIIQFIYHHSKSEEWACVGALIYLLLPYTWANAFSGLETSLFVLLVTASFYYTAKKNWSVAFLLISLSCLTRPDGTLAGIILGTSISLLDKSDRVHALRAMIRYFVLPMLLYGTFKLLYFGDLLPNSFYVKTEGTGFHGISNLKDFVRGNVVLVILSLLAFWRNRDKWKTVMPFMLWSGLLLLFYLWPEPLQGFYQRFNWPVVPSLIVLTIIGLSTQKLNWQSILIVTLIIGIQIGSNLPGLHRDMQLASHERGRQIYREVGLALHSLPNHERMTFAFQDAGAIPYYSEMQHIDLVGLNTTAIAKSKSALEAYNVIKSVKPDIILIPAYHDTCECWNVFYAGHGKAANLVPELIHQPIMTDFSCVGRITYLGYDIVCYVIPKYAQALQSEFSQYAWFIPGPIPCLQ